VAWLKLGRSGDSQLRIAQPLPKSIAAERFDHLRCGPTIGSAPKIVNSRSPKAAASASAGSPAGNFEQTQLSDHNGSFAKGEWTDAD
jgi:hypothetical protein